MTRRGRGHDNDWLTDGIATVFRLGTVIAMAIVVVGYAWGLVRGTGDGQQPLLDQLRGGGPEAVIAAGLFALTLLPIAVVIAAGIGFARGGERNRMLTSAAVLGLLLVSLAAAAILAQAG
jgi:uncharacterized membrane protein